MYDRHEVSVKVALYSSDGECALMMYYPRDDGFGLPGGHIDAGETPDVALRRELREELGITIDATPRLTVTLNYRTERVMAVRNDQSG